MSKPNCSAVANQVASMILESDCPELALEWTVDHVIGNMILNKIGKARQCYDRLVELGHVCSDDVLKRAAIYDKSFEYNDLDCTAMVLGRWEASATDAFLHTDQNCSYVYVIPKAGDAGMYAQMQIYEYSTLGQLKMIVAVQGSGYNDSRDEGFVGSSPCALTGFPERHSIGNYHRVKHSLLNIDTLHCALFEEE